MKSWGIIGGLIFLFVFNTQIFAENTQKNYEIALTKGVYAIENGDYENAVKELERALTFKPGDRDAMLSLGVALARSRNNEKAKEVLTKALEQHGDDTRIKYELGVVLSRLGESEKAAEYFADLGRSDVEEDLKDASTSYIEILASREEPQEKTYAMHLLGGLQYDSNVILEPSNPVKSSDRKSDWRTVLSLDTRWNFLRGKTFSGKAQYMFYQSIHNKLNDYNIHQHNLKLSGVWNMSETAHFQMKYRLTYSLAGGDLYNSSHEITPSFRFVISPKLITTLEYSHQFNIYFNSDIFEANADRSGEKDIIGITQNICIGSSTGLTISYNYDMDRTDTPYWDYDGHRGTLLINTSFGKIKAFLSASYHDRKYRDPIPGYTDKRHDGVQEYSLNIIFPASKRINVTIGEIYVINQSNIEFYDYKRSITGILAVISI